MCLLMVFSGGMAFTAFYNVLDFPAGVVPVTKVTKNDIDDSKNFPTPRGPEKVAKEVCQSVEADLTKLHICAIGFLFSINMSNNLVFTTIIVYIFVFENQITKHSPFFVYNHAMI